MDRRWYQKIDWALFVATFTIPLLGLTVLYSAGYNPDRTPSGWGPFALLSMSPPCYKQMIFVLVGMVALLVTALIPPSFLARIAYLLYGGGVLSLIAVALFGVVSKGSRRWLDFGPLHLQPSELVKLSVIIVIAKYLSRKPPESGGYKFHQILIPFALFLVPMMLIVKQPDLGTGLVVGCVGFLMILVMGIRRRVLISMVLAAAAALPFAWHSLHEYQQNRIINLFDPDFDPKGSGYHVAQSKIAVGSGQLFGKGFLQGTQTQLEFLPEHTTDFIFSVLAEEWGFLGCLTVLFAYFHLLYRILKVMARSKDLFNGLLALGIACLVFFHLAVNVGMVVGLLPVVGIPLPLFSYGGSSILTMSFSIGLVMGVSVRRGSY